MKPTHPRSHLHLAIGPALIGALIAGQALAQSAGGPGRSAGGKNPLNNVYFGEQHMHPSDPKLVKRQAFYPGLRPLFP